MEPSSTFISTFILLTLTAKEFPDFILLNCRLEWSKAFTKSSSKHL